MKNLLLLFLGLLFALPIWAKDDASVSTTGWSGAAGVGPIVFPRYTGGNASQTWIIPQVSATYDDILYVEPLRAGMYCWGSEDKKMGFGLAVEPRFGFKGTDGTRLAGMTDRRNSLEAGPAFDWELGVVSLSASLFTDVTNSSRGQSARLYAYREMVSNETWQVGAFLGVDRLSSKVANYFFGVEALESTSRRPAFQAQATCNTSVGLDGRYRFSRDYSLLFGLQLTKLSDELARSPIVDNRQSFLGWVGLAWNLN